MSEDANAVCVIFDESIEVSCGELVGSHPSDGSDFFAMRERGEAPSVIVNAQLCPGVILGMVQCLKKSSLHAENENYRDALGLLERDCLSMLKAIDAEFTGSLCSD